MSDTFRMSPSGPVLAATGSGAVDSVYGRQGEVVGDAGDYDTTQIDNASDVPGATLTDALDELLGSDGRVNGSSVPGATVSDALDYLDANISPAPRGALLDTFSGGQVSNITAPQNTGNLGDLGWCVNTIVTSSGWTISRLPPESGVIGAIRITGPTSSAAASGGPYVVYGQFDNTQDDGPLTWGDVSEIYFRVRADPAPTGASGTTITAWGVVGLESGGGASVGVGFIANVAGLLPPNGPNFFAGSSVNPGVTLNTDTLVPVDSEYHDFIIRRVDATTIEFEIDGVVVVTHTGGSVPSSGANVTFYIAVNSPDSPSPQRRTFVDIDTFEFTPA